MRRGVLTAVLALAMYVVLVVLLTWPLASKAASHLPEPNFDCRYDTLYMAAVLAHQSRALLGEGPSFLDLNIYHPARGTLFYGETGLGLLAYFFPIFALTGNPTLALTLGWLSCLALTAWTSHLVVRWWTGSHLAGFIAGWVFLLSPWVLWTFVPASPSYSVLQYFPLIVYLAATPAPSFVAALRLLPLVVLQCLTNVAYVAPAVMVPLGLLALARMSRRTTRAAGARLLGVLAITLVLLSPVYAGHVAVSLGMPDIRRQSVWWGGTELRKVFATSLPWGPFQNGPSSLPAAAWMVLGLGSLSFATRAWRGEAGSRRPWAHAFFWSAIGLVMSITPIARWQGKFVRSPMQLLAEWTPLYEFVRDPARLAVAALVGLTLLCGLAFAECVRRLLGDIRTPAKQLAAAGLAMVVAIAAYAGPAGSVARTAALGAYPIAKAIGPDSPVVERLREPGRGSLLELPIGALEQRRPKRTSQLFDVLSHVFHARAMYRSTFHSRPLLNGYSGYRPADFPERMELARRLPDPEALAVLREQTGLELILVHTDDLGRSEREGCAMLARGSASKRCSQDFGARERAEWLRIAEQGGRPDLRLVARDGGDLLFAVAP